MRLAGVAIFLLMGLLGFLMRLNHAGVLPIRTDFFYQAMTLHGSGMIAATPLAAMGGCIAVLEQTVQLNLRGLGIAFGSYLAGTGLVIVAIVLGGFAAGWTVLYPLPFDGTVWGAGAALVMYAGYFGVGFGFVLFCLNVLVATASAYGAGAAQTGFRSISAETPS